MRCASQSAPRGQLGGYGLRLACRLISMRKVATWLKHEIRSLLPIWLFFLGAFGLLRLTQSVILAQYGIQGPQASFVVIGSIIVAKVFLIMEKFHFIERFREKAVIYNSLWKTWVYFVGCLVFQFLDGMIRLMRAGNSLKVAGAGRFREMAGPRFWIIQLWLILLLLAFSSARELIRALGKERFLAMFFGRSGKSTKERPIRRIA